MVRYTGRQKTITGSVNRNQVGLKMSGCPSRVGRSGKNIRFLGRRVNCMYGLCGPTMVNGAPWRTSGRNKPPYCRQRSTACAQAAGGVGHINSPYTRTRVPAAGKQGCTQVNVGANTPWWYNNPAVLQAVSALSAFLLSQSPPLVLSLVGRHEHLTTDLDQHLGDYGLTLDDDFNHYEAGHTEYDNLPPQMQSYANIINSIKLSRSIIPGGPSRLHIAGAVTQNAKSVLQNETAFGRIIWLGYNTSIIAYADAAHCCYEFNPGLGLLATGPNGVTFVGTGTGTGFAYRGFKDQIQRPNKLLAYCGDCCTEPGNFWSAGFCKADRCDSAPENGDFYYTGGRAMLRDDDLTIGSHPPLSNDHALWKTIYAYDGGLTAQTFINTLGTGSTIPAYTIIPNHCSF